MDFRLKVFVLSAEKLSYTKAAQELGISQPAVSKHIKALEEEYKIQLFTKIDGRLSLTYEGEIFLQNSKRIINLYKDLEKESQLISQAPVGNYLLKVPSAIYYGFIPSFVGEFCRLSPHSTIKVEINDLDESTKQQKRANNNIVININTVKNEDKINQNDILFNDQLIVAGNSSIDPNGYYDLHEIKFFFYTSDNQTLKEIITSFSESEEDQTKIKTSGTLIDPQSAIRLLLSYHKHHQIAPLAASFLWKSQISKFLKDQKLRIVNIVEFQDIILPKRTYSITSNDQESSKNFISFLRNWIDQNLT